MKHTAFVPLLLVLGATISINLYDLLSRVYNNGINDFIAWQSSYSSPSFSLMFGLVGGSFIPNHIMSKVQFSLVKRVLNMAIMVVAIEAIFSTITGLLLNINIQVLAIVFYRLCQLYPAFSLSLGALLGYVIYNDVENN